MKPLLLCSFTLSVIFVLLLLQLVTQGDNPEKVKAMRDIARNERPTPQASDKSTPKKAAASPKPVKPHRLTLEEAEGRRPVNFTEPGTASRSRNVSSSLEAPRSQYAPRSQSSSSEHYDGRITEHMADGGLLVRTTRGDVALYGYPDEGNVRDGAEIGFKASRSDSYQYMNSRGSMATISKLIYDDSSSPSYPFYRSEPAFHSTLDERPGSSRTRR